VIGISNLKFEIVQEHRASYSLTDEDRRDGKENETPFSHHMEYAAPMDIISTMKSNHRNKAISV
jgi:hypothetical protein